ncbi:ABC transporter, ATP-binding/permease protein [Euzebya pacifica]|uniref:ABC transporter, ATP-binding/permease protein n=1 Tax=Euzebya pacifica TaxID=1608957 RepID=A0A346XTH6_9ACTN|nr:ABC transporter ATP-binding protein [Euzebya pacifica]AXV05523.1 ABC transporter, ATP-binding/permease protein [Euzebya pacifica]
MRTSGEGSADLSLLTAHLRPERRQLLGLLGVLLVAMLLPVAGPVLLGNVVDAALAGRPTGVLLRGAVAFLVVTLFADGLQLALTRWSVALAWRVGNRLRLDLARHALRLDLTWHGDHSPGLLIERIDGDVDAIVRFSSSAVLNLLGNAVLLTGTLAVALVIEWRAGLLIAAASLLAVEVMRRMRRAAVPFYDEEREVQASLYGDLEERLGGLEDVRANGAAGYAVHRLHESSARWWRVARRASMRGDGAYAIAAAVFTIGSVATLALAIWLQLAGRISLGEVLALFRFSQMVRQPLEAIAEQITEFQRAVAGSRRAARLLATAPDIEDGPGAHIPPGPLSVDFDDVHFAYPDEPERVVLAGIDMHLPAGSVVGVVGRTGSGKTSLGRLLVRFWDVTGGSIRLGGVDVREPTGEELRRRVGVVTQEVQILRASLRDNLTLLGAVEATDDQLVAAMQEVGLGGWLAAQPDGLDTHLEGAGGLSAGQAQLLAFARILLTDPGLIVLDEATSRLDPATEALVTRATDRVFAGRTVVIIAHRLATLDRADIVVVIDEGRVLEAGPRADLARRHRGRYAALLQESAGVGGQP